MRILSRYLLRRFLATFLAATLILVLTIVVVEMLRDFGEILEREQGLRGALDYVLFRIPSFYLPYLIPAAAFVATLVSLGMAARSLEFMAIRAGGVSPWRALGPVLAAGLALSLLALILNEAISVPAARAWNRRGEDPESQLALHRGESWYQNGRFIYSIRDADPDTGSVRGVAVFGLDEQGRLVTSIRAERADQLGAGRWAFHEATLRRFDPENPGTTPQFEQAERMEIELPGAPSASQLHTRVATLSLAGLSEYVKEHESAGGSVRRARARLHARLTEPLSAFVFVLLAIPLALRIEQTKSIARSALHGVVILFTFYVVREYGSTLASRGLAPATATAWLVLGSFAAFGAWRLSRIPR